MEKQNNKEIELKNLKIKFLEKSIPSLLKLEMKEIAKTKFFKHQVYCLIYENEATSVLSIRNMCKELNLHKSKYLEWKTRHELLAHKELRQLYRAKSIDGIWMPIFSTKEDLSATEMVDRYCLENNNLASGSNRIRIWIKKTFNKSISNKLIRKIQKTDIARRPTCHRNKKSGSGTYTLQKYVREDLVLDNTITNRIGEFIGMYGLDLKN